MKIKKQTRKLATGSAKAGQGEADLADFSWSILLKVGFIATEYFQLQNAKEKFSYTVVRTADLLTKFY